MKIVVWGGGCYLDNNRKEPKRLKKIIVSLISIVTLIMVVSFSYAYIKYDVVEKRINVVGTNCIKLTLADVTDAINIEQAFPITDDMGKRTQPYQFSLTNDCETAVSYHVNLETINTSTLDAKYVAVFLNQRDNPTEEEIQTLDQKSKANPIEVEGEELTIKESHNIGEGTLKGQDTVYYDLRIWLDESADNNSQEKEFNSRIAIEAVQNLVAEYSEPILNGADPVLDKEGKLVPVTIENNGVVKKANLSNAWYSYADHKWANAVILGDNTDMPKDGEVIAEEAIESYFVWIPKYSYKIFNLTEYSTLGTIEEKAQEIEIQFGLDNTGNTSEECATPMLDNGVQGASGATGNCSVGKWMTHPAFLAFGGNGFWVGKFESGYKDATSTSTAQVDSKDASKLIIKPNVYSWRNITVGNAFTVSKSYEPNMKSHMMKNTEWGAVAYLSHSIYGTCNKSGEEKATCTEVRINNNSGFVTGYSAKVAPTTGYDGYKDYGNVTPGSNNETGSSDFKGTYNYKNTASQNASTTNNYSGIYDMSGGAWEYVASVQLDAKNSPTYLASGLDSSTLNDARYYDVYNYGSNSGTDFRQRILGDATGEMGPFQSQQYNNQNRQIGSWYNDEAWFVVSSNPWFSRGGSFNNGTGSGVFNFGRNSGGTHTYHSFRLVLAPSA